MMMLSCKEMAEKATRGEFDDAGWLTRLLIRMHIGMCEHCRRFSAQMKFISRAAKERAAQSVDAAHLDAFKRRLKDRLAG